MSSFAHPPEPFQTFKQAAETLASPIIEFSGPPELGHSRRWIGPPLLDWSFTELPKFGAADIALAKAVSASSDAIPAGDERALRRLFNGCSARARQCEASLTSAIVDGNF